jgi:hypothetical protein
MNPKLILCLALVLSGGLLGCSTEKFKVVSSREHLAENHQIVAVVTCTEAKPTQYSTFGDRYLSIGAMPPRVHWNAVFQVDEVLQGAFTNQSFTLNEIKDVETWSHFYFKAGKRYTVGFNRTSNHKIKKFAVLSTNSPAVP